MDLTKVNATYFNKLFKWEDKAKILLVDKYTMLVISMCYTQSQLLHEDVILTELVDNHLQLDTMKHLNCVIYIKPTSESIDALCREISNPHFHSYRLFFNNIVNKGQLEKIAEFDKFEILESVVELFQDYLVIDDLVFEIQANSVIEETNKLLSLLLLVKKCPVIKHEPSINCKKLSSELLYQINSNMNNNLFENFNYDTTPVLLLFDRMNDPITPLLAPWTYRSMIHELIGIHKNIVTIGPDKFLLNEDEFFAKSKFLNYGDLTDTFQKKVETFKRESNNNNLETSNLMELKKILTRLPDLKKKSANILKHLNIITELDNKISQQNLWEISELQQTIVCNLDSKSYVDEQMTKHLSNPAISIDHKVKLILVYSIRFKDITKFVNLLNQPSIAQLKLLTNFHKTFKVAYQHPPSEHNFKKLLNFGHNKEGNIFLQYTPPLKTFLTSFINGVTNNLNTLVPETIQESGLQDIIVYFKGGVTYEEIKIVAEFNQQNRFNFIIGGDDIVNSDVWLRKLYDMV